MVLNIGSYTIGNYLISQNQTNVPANEIDFDGIIKNAVACNGILQMDKLNAPSSELNPAINTQITDLSNNTNIDFIDEMLENQVDILKENGIKLSGTSEEIADKLQDIAKDNNIGITDLMSAIIHSRVIYTQTNRPDTDYITYLTNIIRLNKYNKD